MITDERLDRAIHDLDRWLTANGWAGWDPYDLPSRQYAMTKRGIAGRAGSIATGLIARVAPRSARKLAGVTPEINAKAMGLLAEAYRSMYNCTKEVRHLNRAHEAIDWLQANASSEYPGMSWGYPFDWRSRVFIPRGTPSSVVTATVGEAFMGFYRQTGDSKYLDTCRDICTFFLEGLHRDSSDEDRICFSYTPIDRFHVHNANLMVAAFLVATAGETGEDRLLAPALQAINYTLSEQNDDGSICYWGRDQGASCHIDHYHSGFEIRSLHEISKRTSDPPIRTAVERYYDFYCRNLFDDRNEPKFTPARKYPINIHAAAEAILCHTELASNFPQAREYLDVCVPWAIDQMQTSTGAFAYTKRYVLGVLPWRSNIPYLRWGQAWMMRALTAYKAVRQASDRENRNPGAAA